MVRMPQNVEIPHTAPLVGPRYKKALAALEQAHRACFAHPNRGVLGMSRGPFSGVNEALGIVYELENELAVAEAVIAKLCEERAAK